MKTRIPFFSEALLLLFFVASCGSSGKANKKRLPGIWQEQPITVDGNNADWPSPYPEYDSKAMLGYAVSNDKDNLYITVETGDAATQLKILRGGLTVWINKTGKKGEEVAINYPIPAYATKAERENKDKKSSDEYWLKEQNKSAPMQKRMLELREKVKKALGDVKEYSLQGFKGCNLQFPMDSLNSCGITVRVDVDKDDELIWEAKIPFKAFYYKAVIDRVDKGKPVSVCFETTGFKNPGGGGQGHKAGSGGRGMGSVRPGFGMGGMGMRMGGSGGMRGGNRQGAQEPPNILGSLFTSSTTWKRFGLAWK